MAFTLIARPPQLEVILISMLSLVSCDPAAGDEVPAVAAPRRVEPVLRDGGDAQSADAGRLAPCLHVGKAAAAKP